MDYFIKCYLKFTNFNNFLFPYKKKLNMHQIIIIFNLHSDPLSEIIKF